MPVKRPAPRGVFFFGQMADLKKSFTNISEVARQRLGITRDEYALCAYIAYRIADPRQRISGWCCDTKEEIAAFVGVTRAGLYKMVSRLIVEELIEAGGAVPFVWKVTTKWVDTENNCKQSLQDSVNKVDTDCKQSLRRTVNKVYTHNKVEYDISKSKEERGDNEKNSPTPDGNSVSLEAEKEKKNPPVPPAPPYSGPTLVELHDAAHPDIPVFDIVPPAPVTQPPTNRIELGDRPTAETPVQLESALREFYTDWPNEWSVGILENGRGRKYDASKQVEIVKDFCCWAVDNNKQRDTFRQLNARLQGWFRNEQHSTWKQAKPGQPGNTEKPVYERPKNAIY